MISENDSGNKPVNLGDVIECTKCGNPVVIILDPLGRLALERHTGFNDKVPKWPCPHSEKPLNPILN